VRHALTRSGLKRLVVMSMSPAPKSVRHQMHQIAMDVFPEYSW
jgi:hypothetical protein